MARPLSEKHDDHAFVASLIGSIGIGLLAGHANGAVCGIGAGMAAFVPIYFLARFMFKVLDTPDAIVQPKTERRHAGGGYDE